MQPLLLQLISMGSLICGTPERSGLPHLQFDIFSGWAPL